MKTNSYTTLVKGKPVTFKHIGAKIMPSFKDVTSVSVIPFTKEGNIVAVRLKHRGLDLPGGHVEPGETTPEQTMNREVMEEAGVTISSAALVEVIQSDYYDHPSYMLLYGAVVDEFHEFTATDEEMSEGREIVSQAAFIERYQAGNKELMQQAIQSAWQTLQSKAIQQVTVYTVRLPDYQVHEEPDHKALGKTVDDELKEHFMNQTIVARGIGSSEHPGKTIDELGEIILRDGTDRYDQTRKGDRYKNIQGKHIDLFGFRRKVTPRMQLFKDIIYGFYYGAISIHGQPTRIDILILYDATKLKAVVHQYEGRADRKRDGFVFKDPANKVAALLGVVKVAG